MTQTMDTVESPPVDEQWTEEPAASTSLPNAQEYEQFNYRPMPVLAPVAGVLGVSSLLAYLGLFGIALAVVGVFVGVMAVVVIKRASGELSGMKVAVFGLALCLLNSVAGAGLQVYYYKTEVWDGFNRVNFTEQISKQGFITENGTKKIPPQVEALFGKPIFLKGFMYPQNQTEDLPGFLLLKDSGQCCFGGQPALEDMIGVRMIGEPVDYYNGRVSVAGTLKLNEKYQGGSLEPIYILEAEHFSKAKTSF